MASANLPIVYKTCEISTHGNSIKWTGADEGICFNETVVFFFTNDQRVLLTRIATRLTLVTSFQINGYR